MPDSFELTIKLGNDAMQSSDDVAQALRAVADRIERGRMNEESGKVRDINGNSVGGWTFA